MHKPTPEEMRRFYINAVANNHQDFVGDWNGWKMRGRYLISPHKERVVPHQLDRILWKLEVEKRAQRESAKDHRLVDEAASSFGSTVVPFRPRPKVVERDLQADLGVLLLLPTPALRDLRDALQAALQLRDRA